MYKDKDGYFRINLNLPVPAGLSEALIAHQFRFYILPKIKTAERAGNSPFKAFMDANIDFRIGIELN